VNKVEFHPAAVQEVRRARAHYAKENPVAAARFIDELRRTLTLVHAVRILAVAHQNRRPGYWSRR